jgi:hypothetical protein
VFYERLVATGAGGGWRDGAGEGVARTVVPLVEVRCPPPPKKEWALVKRSWRVFSAPVTCGMGGIGGSLFRMRK